jgi:tetratricopeptide (TPR) repeat protein
LAGCWNDLGNLQRDTNKPAQAEPSYRNARGLFARQTKLKPDEASVWAGLAGSSMNLGRLLGGRQQNQEAESLLREAITIDRHWLAENPQAASWRYDLAAALGNLADSLGTQSRFDEGEACYQEALALWTGLTTEFPERLNYHQALIAGRCGLAALFASRGNLVKAEGAYREAIASTQRLVSAYPRVPDYARTLASARIRLARILVARGQMVEADEILQEALAQLNAFSLAHPDKLPIGPEEAACACELGEIRENKKDLPAAEKFYRQAAVRLDALTTEQEEAPESAWLRGRIAGGLANVLFEAGRRAEAGEACALALSHKNRLAASHPEVAGYQADVAWSLLACTDPAQRDPQKAIAFAIRATDLRPQDSAAWFVRGAAEFRGGHWQNALASLEKSCQFGNGEDPAAWFYLALIYRKFGEPAKASHALNRGEAGFVRQVHAERTMNEVREETLQAFAIDDLPGLSHPPVQSSPKARSQE